MAKLDESQQLPNIIEQDKLILWLLLKNGGQFYHTTIEPINRFARDGITKVLNERVAYETSGIISGNEYKCKFYFTNVEVLKPQLQDIPLLPLVAQRRKLNYAAKIMATAHFEAWQNGKQIQHSTSRTELCDFLVPICSNMCNLVSLKPTDPYDPDRFVSEAIHALHNNFGDIPECEEGIYIIGGNIHVLSITKDKTVNKPFINIHEVMIGKTPRIVAYCNVLCSAPKTTSVNISFAILPDAKKNIMFRWFIKSPPINNVKLPFLALFYMLGIFNREVILQNIMMHIKKEYQDECFTRLLVLIESSEMANINNFTQFQNALFDICSQDKDIVKTVSGYVKSGLTPDITMALFSIRFLPNIQGENMTLNRMNFICSTIAEMIISYNKIDKLGDINEAREKINATNRSMQSARIDTAYEISVLRLTYATYTHIYKPVQRMIMHELYKAEGDVRQLPKNMATFLTKKFDVGPMSKTMCSKEFKRTSVQSTTLSVENFKMLDGKMGAFGRSMRAITLMMFRDYSNSTANLEMRIPAHDSTCVICPHTTGEGNPGMNRSFALSVILSFPEVEVDEIHNELLKRIVFCNHRLCMRIKFDGIIIGTACHIDKVHGTIRKLRREIPKMRFITMYYEEEMNVFDINYQNGHPFVPVLPVVNHLNDYINGKLTHPHISEVKLSRRICRDIAEGKRSLASLIKDGIIEYISANEISFTYVCETLERFAETQDNPLYCYDYVFMASQHASFHALINLAMSMAPSQRNVYQLSQARMIAEWGSSKMTVKKSSATFDTMQPLGCNIANTFVQASSRNVFTLYAPDAGADEEGSTLNLHAISRGLGVEYMTDKLYYVISNDQKLLKRDEIGPMCPDYIDKDGFPKIGTVIRRGDPIIFIFSSQNGGNIITEEYRQDLPAVVTGHIMPSRGSRQIVEVYFASEMPMSYTAKISHCTGNKSMPSRLESPRRMPKMINGMVPSIILSVFMCRKRNINDHVMNGNGWSVLETGNVPYYHPFMTPAQIRPSEKFQSRMKQEDHSTFYTVTGNGKMSKDPAHISPVPTRRLEKYGILDSNFTSMTKYNSQTNMATRGPKSVNGGMVDGEMDTTARCAVGTAGFNAAMITDAVDMRVCRYCREFVVASAKLGMICQRCRSSEYDVVTMSFSTNVLKQKLAGSRIDLRFKTYMPGLSSSSGHRGSRPQGRDNFD